MRELILTNRFRKSFKIFVKKHPLLKSKIFQILELVKEDVFSSLLSTHKLSGALYGLRACSCGYDCRIIFSIELNNKTNRELIILFEIGNHDEVY